MSKKRNISGFINTILASSSFTWFGLLEYVLKNAEEWKTFETKWEERDPQQKTWRKVPATARDCFKLWRKELGIGEGGPAHCLWLEQGRPNGDRRFYVFIAGPCSSEEEPLIRWRVISKRWSHLRPWPKSIAGFLCHMVMRGRCTLGVDCEGARARYYKRKDFIPWKPKDS